MDTIPNEILTHIIQFVPTADYICCILTCRLWHDAFKRYMLPRMEWNLYGLLVRLPPEYIVQYVYSGDLPYPRTRVFIQMLFVAQAQEMARHRPQDCVNTYTIHMPDLPTSGPCARDAIFKMLANDTWTSVSMNTEYQDLDCMHCDDAHRVLRCIRALSPKDLEVARRQITLGRYIAAASILPEFKSGSTDLRPTSVAYSVKLFHLQHRITLDMARSCETLLDPTLPCFDVGQPEATFSTTGSSTVDCQRVINCAKRRINIKFTATDLVLCPIIAKYYPVMHLMGTMCSIDDTLARMIVAHQDILQEHLPALRAAGIMPYLERETTFTNIYQDIFTGMHTDDYKNCKRIARHIWLKNMLNGRPWRACPPPVYRRKW